MGIEIVFPSKDMIGSIFLFTRQQACRPGVDCNSWYSTFEHFKHFLKLLIFWKVSRRGSAYRWSAYRENVRFISSPSWLYNRFYGRFLDAGLQLLSKYTGWIKYKIHLDEKLRSNRQCRGGLRLCSWSVFTHQIQATGGRVIKGLSRGCLRSCDLMLN